MQEDPMELNIAAFAEAAVEEEAAALKAKGQAAAMHTMPVRWAPRRTLLTAQCATAQKSGDIGWVMHLCSTGKKGGAGYGMQIGVTCIHGR